MASGAGALRERLRIENATFTRSSYGESVPFWSPALTIHAQQLDASGSENVSEIGTTVNVRKRYRIRFNSSLTTAQRMILNDALWFDVLSIVPEDSKRKWMLMDVVWRGQIASVNGSGTVTGGGGQVAGTASLNFIGSSASVTGTGGSVAGSASLNFIGAGTATGTGGGVSITGSCYGSAGTATGTGGAVAGTANNGIDLQWYAGDALPAGSTFTRASTGAYNDASGVLQSAASGVLRDSHYIGGVRGVLREPGAVNKVLQSENFGTTWVAIGTPTRSAGAIPVGTMGVVLDLIGCDDIASLEGYRQTVTLTGGAVPREYSVYVKKGASPPASGSAIVLRDNTAAVDRLRGTLTWSGTVPSVAMAAGAYLGFEAMAGGVYRLLFRAAAAVTANTNRVEIYPVGTIGETGDVYMGGVQVTDMETCTSYIKTTTATVTRSADRLALAIPDAVERSCTMYVKRIERGEATDSTNCLVAIIGSGTTNPRLTLLLNGTASKMQGRHRNSAAADSLTATTALSIPAFGSVIESRLDYDVSDGSVLLGESVNGSAEVTTARAAGVAPDASWSGAFINVGATNTTSDCIGVVVGIKLMRGSGRTMTACRLT